MPLRFLLHTTIIKKSEANDETENEPIRHSFAYHSPIITSYGTHTAAEKLIVKIDRNCMTAMIIVSSMTEEL